MSQRYASSNPPTTIRLAASRDLYRQRKPQAATRSPVRDIAVQNRLDGNSAESNTNDRNIKQASVAITSGRIRARCLRLERSRRISIAVADAKQKRGMLVRTSATFVALIGRRSMMSISRNEIEGECRTYMCARLKLLLNPGVWHFNFHGYGPDAERLVAGRERIYFDRIWDDFTGDPSKPDEATRNFFAATYALPGGMRAGFAQFTAFSQDAKDNKIFEQTKLPMPVLAVGGEKSLGALQAVVMRHVATKVEHDRRDLHARSIRFTASSSRKVGKKYLEGEVGPKWTQIRGTRESR
jgi:hypothetical protein